MPDYSRKGRGRGVRTAAEIMVNLPGGTAGPFYGRTNVTSQGRTSVVISSTIVGTASLIKFNLQAMQVNSEALPHFVVQSINPGVAFVIGTVQSYVMVGSYVAMWEIKNPL